MPASDVLLRFCDVAHQFPGVRALDGVSFDVHPAEVLALIGENGAGKSTLMKVLTGNYPLQEGSILLEGHSVSFSGYAAAVRKGIHMVYQELSLANDLTVAENVFVGHEHRSRLGFLSYRSMERATADLLMRLGLDLSPQTLVDALSIGEKQLVEIAKAISQDARLLVLDEPTSALPAREVQRLFELLRGLRDEGVAIIYITHRLDEVFEISDRTTILRDGRCVGTFRTSELPREKAISLQAGKDIVTSSSTRLTPQVADGETIDVLKISGLGLQGSFDSISLEVPRGRIVGLFGLLGSGTKALAETVFGVRRASRGSIQVSGKHVMPRSPQEAIAHGIAYLPPNRREEGLFLDKSITQNIASVILDSSTRGGLIDHKGMAQTAGGWGGQLSIVARSNSQEVSTLSGGNQQKVCLAKWLASHPVLLVADEPTAGIDVGAKFEVQNILESFCEQGNAVLLVSSDIEEVVRLCHTVWVMKDGRIAGKAAGDTVTKERILGLAL